MTPSKRTITDAELVVLEALWTEPRQTIRSLMEALYPRGSPSDYATVQKLLERLEGKQYVRRDRSAQVHVFEAVYQRNEHLQAELQQVADTLCQGSLAPLLLQLVESVRLSPKQRAQLRQMLDEAKDRSPGGK